MSDGSLSKGAEYHAEYEFEEGARCRTQDPNVRNNNFEEVALGYTAEMAINEARPAASTARTSPAQAAARSDIHIPEFIARVAEGDFQAAYEIIARDSALPSVSGRVCPQESQCEARCVRAIKGEPVAIGRLERFVADWYRENVNAMPHKSPTPMASRWRSWALALPA